MSTNEESSKILKLVWDTSALINLKEPDSNGYSPAFSLMKDVSNAWYTRPYKNIFPAISVFEWSATISRKQRDGQKILRELYIMDEHASIYPIDEDLIGKCNDLVVRDGFSSLRGADLIFACIAYLEDAFLVTKDRDFEKIKHYVRVIDLNNSLHSANYCDQIAL